jgi:HAD superfamily hydrolase (TIGR01459 family)
MMTSVANQNLNPKKITGLGEVAAFYDGVILDLWGVVHDGVRPFPDTIATLQELRRSKRIIWLLSNAPRRAAVVKKHLADMGIDEDLYDGIVTSGEATWLALRDKYIDKWGKRCFHLGPEVNNKSIYEHLPLDLVRNIEEAEFILNSGIYDHFNDTAEQYEPLLDAAAARKLPMICANPDRLVHVGDRIVLCPGTLAEMYEARGGEVVWLGKPYRTVYSMCLEAMGVRRVLALGDSMVTDIAGATAAGIDSGLIVSGIHREELFTRENPENLNENRLHTLLMRYPFRPQYLLHRFSW